MAPADESGLSRNCAEAAGLPPATMTSSLDQLSRNRPMDPNPCIGRRRRRKKCLLQNEFDFNTTKSHALRLRQDSWKSRQCAFPFPALSAVGCIIIFPMPQQVCICSFDIDKTVRHCLTLSRLTKEITKNLELILNVSNSLFCCTVAVKRMVYKKSVLLHCSYFAQQPDLGQVSLK
jgi:hypothetical protein